MWRNFILILIAILYPVLLFATINKTILKDGSLLLTNHPNNPDEIINLLSSTHTASKIVVKNQEEKRQLIILSPKDGETFHNVQELKVDFQTVPPLKTHEKVELLLDGKSIMQSEKSPFLITDLNRGTHEIALKWLDAHKETLAVSRKTTLYVHQNHVK